MKILECFINKNYFLFTGLRGNSWFESLFRIFIHYLCNLIFIIYLCVMQKRHFMMKNFIGFLLVIILMSSCSEYQKLLKSGDSQAMYKKAVEYYNNGDYTKASNLFDGIRMVFQGTSKAQSNHSSRVNRCSRHGNSITSSYITGLFSIPSGVIPTPRNVLPANQRKVRKLTIWFIGALFKIL